MTDISDNDELKSKIKKNVNRFYATWTSRSLVYQSEAFMAFIVAVKFLFLC